MFNKQVALDKLRDYEKPITWVNAAVILSLVIFGYSRLASSDGLLGAGALLAAGAFFWFDQHRYKRIYGLTNTREPWSRAKTVQLAISLTVTGLLVYVFVAGS